MLKSQSFLDHLCEKYPEYATYFRAHPPKVEPTFESDDDDIGGLERDRRERRQNFQEKVRQLDEHNEEVRQRRHG